MSDDIERRPQEEEDYSVISSNESDIEYEEEDDFDSALDESIAADLDSNNDDVQADFESEDEEASANNFFTENEPEEDFRQEASSEEVIMPDGEVIEEDEIQPQNIRIEEENSYIEQEEPEVQPEAVKEVVSAVQNSIPDNEDISDIDTQGDVEAFYEEEQNEDEFRKVEIPVEDEPVLPEPVIDERIEDDLNSELQGEEAEIQNENSVNSASEEFVPAEDGEQTPYENKLEPDNAPLMSEDEDLQNDLIEQVAKDIDQTFIYNKIEEDSLEEENPSIELTEDDLNFIDDINHGENEILEPVTDAPENFDEERDDNSEDEQEPVVPVYQAKIPEAAQTFEQGDHVSHPKYGEGIVEKMIRYGNKTLCSINFVNVGRRLLDPAISEISKL